ncbi:TIR domain-containing protein [Massilia litorea]|uniref:Toll-Interleukin receptor n=1 Tax=Massilia litorea TaxID=2769491 RepID=A0A7L9U2J7_9BURK|nr:toll-Interleukin receptor [Massilia litorea]QOL48649.1 toll-Interleukin receptor [Massilia litorea]
MKVFMSWSGSRSRAAAELLKWWTRSIIQAARPWISTEDVDRGSLWFSEISNNLSDTAIGIVCLTQENKDRPWILFEAGALAKGLSNSRVCTFLVDLEPSDIRDPLAQFNHTQPTEEDMRKLARTLNRQLGDAALDDAVLTDAFDAYWNQFQTRWSKLITEIPQETKVVKRPADDIMSEVLEHVRGMTQRIRKLESASEHFPSWQHKQGKGISAAVSVPSAVTTQQLIVSRMKERIVAGHPLDDLIKEGEDMGYDQTMMELFVRLATVEAKIQGKDIPAEFVRNAVRNAGLS